MLRNMLCKRIGFTLLTLAVIGMTSGAWAQQLPAPNWGAGFPRVMGEKVLLMWLAVPGAESYKIYRNGEVIGTPSSTNFIDQEPQGGENRYVISAIAGGVEGAKSEEKKVTIRILKEIVVQPPNGLASRLTDEAIAVVWNRPRGTILAYNVYRSSESGKGYEPVASIQDNNYLDQNVEVGKTYYYTITALDANFIETPKSKELAVTFTEKAEVATLVELKTYDISIKPTVLEKRLDFLGSNKLLGAVDSAISYKEEKVYIVDQTAGNIKVFDLKGNYLFQFGKKGVTDSDFRLPYGIGIGPDGNLYVADCKQVFVFTPEGKQVKRFSLEPTKSKEIKEAIEASKEFKMKGKIDPCPTDVVFDKKGNMLVVDNSLARIVVYDANGKYKTEFGKYGYGEGELKHPSYIAVNSLGEIGVVDGMNRRAQIFSEDYEFIRVFGKAKTFVGSFLGLGGIAVTKNDNFVIADPPMATIQVFDRATGEYLYHFGNEKGELEPETKQRALWDVANPAGISIDLKNNNLWICMPRTASGMIRHISD